MSFWSSAKQLFRQQDGNAAPGKEDLLVSAKKFIDAVAAKASELHFTTEKQLTPNYEQGLLASVTVRETKVNPEYEVHFAQVLKDNDLTLEVWNAKKTDTGLSVKSIGEYLTRERRKLDERISLADTSFIRSRIISKFIKQIKDAGLQAKCPISSINSARFITVSDPNSGPDVLVIRVPMNNRSTFSAQGTIVQDWTGNGKEFPGEQTERLLPEIADYCVAYASARIKRLGAKK